MEMHITLGIILLTTVMHQSDATDSNGGLEANSTYIGLPGKPLILKWTYTGTLPYDSVSVLISRDVPVAGSPKLWSLFYFKNNRTFKVKEHEIPNSIFNNITTFTRESNSVFILTIKSVPRNLSSFSFDCKVYVTAWVFYNKKITVRTAVKPVIAISSDRDLGHDIVKGSGVELQCIAKHGYPVPKLEWRKDSKVLTQDKSGKALLKLNDIKTEDAGLYVCIATNMAGSGSKDVVITVKYIEIKPGYSTQIKSSLGSTVDLSCPITGYPQVMYGWFKGYSQLGQSSGLTIKIATSEDFGNYTCQGENGIGRIKVTFTVFGEPSKLQRDFRGNANSTKLNFILLLLSTIVLVWYFN